MERERAREAAANGGSSSIPAAARKMVQSLREIVNCPEQEIYAVLNECNMDPSEAVNRLLNQDTFQEVKNKRDKKKEIKDTSESKARGASTALNRGGRFSNERAGRVTSSNSSANGRSKPLLKKENGSSTASGVSLPGYGISESYLNRQSITSSAAPLEVSFVSTDSINMSSKPSSAFQHAWSGTPGQMSMADIVKLGRPQAKPAKSAVVELPNVSHDVVAASNFNSSAKPTAPPMFLSESHQERHSSQDHISDISNIISEHDTGGELVSHESWYDQLASESKSSISLTSPIFVGQSDPSILQEDGLTLPHSSSMSESEIYTTNLEPDEEITATDSTKSITVHHGKMPGASNFDDTSFTDGDFYEHVEHTYQHCKDADDDEEALSVAANFQQMSLQNKDDKPAVIFPEHLQVNVDCSHLSFGSFGSGISASFSGTLLSKSQKSNLELSSTSTPEVVVDPLDTGVHGGNSEHYNDEPVRNNSDEGIDHRASTSAGNYDQFSSPQPAVVGPASSDTSHELQYDLTSSVPIYAFSDATQSTAASHSYSDTIPPVQDLAALSNVMQGYSISLPNNASEPAIQAAREFDLPYSPSLAQQLLAKYGGGISSLNGPAISLSENVKPSLFSMLQPPATQPSSSTNLPTGHTLPQQLPVPHYSQPTLPFGPFTNMIGYPFLPPSYTYLPSAAFQQAYAGSNAYHQSPAAVNSAGIKYTLPQYKSSVSVSSLPDSSVLPSSYGGFGSSANIPGSYMLNPQTVSGGTTLGYNDTLPSHQFKEGNHYSSLQQGENSTLWLQQGGGSRTMPSLPTNAIYGLQGQGQHSGFRQIQQQQQLQPQQQQQQQQQPSQYGVPSFSNFYSHAGASQELPQNPNSGNLNRSQGIPSQSSHQIWQSNY